MGDNWKATSVEHVYERRGKLAYRIKDPTSGKWIYVPSKYVVGQEAEAGKALEKAKRALEAGAEIKPSGGPVTVEEYAQGKFFPRRRDSLEDWKSDETRILDHVLPFKLDTAKTLGDTPLREVRTRHLIDCFGAFRKKLRPNGTPYAPKSIWNTYGVVKALFRDAILDELVFDTPCVLDERHLGVKQDKDPEWRETAIYTMEEAELLMWSPLIPADRRVWYSLLVLACLRIGEAAALRWRAYDVAREPLGRLLISKSHAKEYTKTKRPRQMPVHPVLASILADWRLHGWGQMMGRHPQPDDLMVPCSMPDPGRGGYRKALGDMRTVVYINDRITTDLQALGLRHRRSHDLRATFITQALIDGANKTHLESVTHTAKNQAAFDLYNRVPWSAKCEAVTCLKVRTHAPERGELIPLQAAVGEGKRPNSLTEGLQVTERLVTRLLPPLATNGEDLENNARSTGLEPVEWTRVLANRADAKGGNARASERLGGRAAEPDADGDARADSAGNRVTSASDPIEAALTDALAAWREGHDQGALRLALDEVMAALVGGGQ